MNLVPCQKQLEYHNISEIRIRFIKIIFMYPLRFVKPHKDISKETSHRRTHGCSINLIIKLTFKNKMICDVAKRKSFLSSFLVIFWLGLWLKMRFISISMVSWNGILVKRLATSYETKKFLEIFAFLIWETKEKVSFQSNH